MIGITAGDPAGIGPEITLKALSRTDSSRFLIYSDPEVIFRTAHLCGISAERIRILSAGERAEAGCFNVRAVRSLCGRPYEMGEVSADCGQASYDYIKSAAQDALDRKISLICTAPVNKVSLRLARVPFIGHTEILASLLGADDPLTMFQTGRLRVFFLTRHVALRKACEMVTYERLVSYIPRCIKALESLKVRGPLAVAGLNPHCGDNGLFGTEEREIERAVEACGKKGFDVIGPFGADSVFTQCLRGKFAAVLSLYHDQGHIACKTLDFDRTISLTLGMKVLRLSVDHGTAFDIAGRGCADETGMCEVLSSALDFERELNI